MDGESRQPEHIETGQAIPPKSAGRWAKILVLIWGVVVLLPIVVLLPGFCCAMLSMIGYDEPEVRASSLVLATLVVVAAACGGTMLFGSSRALADRPSRQLRLPPLWAWAAIGAFAIALVIGLGLWQVEDLAPLLGPWFIIAAAALPPVAAVIWAVNGRPGWLTWRRAGVAFSGGVTVSVPLAILLEILVPTIIIGLLLGLGELVLDALGELADLLAGGRVARVLTSPGFRIALVELAVVAPLVEELAKSLVVLPLLKGLKSQRDAFLLGVAAGAGFAALENVIYAFFGGRYWGGILAVRALGAAVHPLGTGLTVVAWYALLNRNPGTDRRWIGAFGLAVVQHAVWNSGLVLWMALSGATFFGPKPWVANPQEAGIAVGILALIALDGVALWIGLRALSRRLDPTAAAEAITAEGISTERAIALWAVACLVILLPVGLAVLQAVWGK
jgi:RsiW-degrading membrane proteinase PrsW (M82 family)